MNPTHTPKDSHYARLRRAHRAANPETAATSRMAHQNGAPVDDHLVRLYGLHTVQAVLNNPEREISRMFVTRNAMNRLELGSLEQLPFEASLVEPREIDRIAGSDCVHQGVLVEARALRLRQLSDLGPASLVLVLDQVTDPHNVGAIMRTSVAFGASALITTSRHSPSESGVLAKSASGALELIDHIQVRNLSEAIAELDRQGFQTIGLDSAGPTAMEDALSRKKIALVLGAEGRGLRQKTRQNVSVLARLEMPGAIVSLNVSNAAAIALYAANRHLSRGTGKTG